MKSPVVAHLGSLGIGVAIIAVFFVAGRRLDGLSWIGGALYALAIGAVHDFFRRGRRQ